MLSDDKEWLDYMPTVYLGLGFAKALVCQTLWELDCLPFDFCTDFKAVGF